MNDHDAMTAINATLDRYFKGYISEPNAINEIAKISGRNAIDHEAAK
ncbi:hypothetical protein [Arthrobacter bambusae]|nr:hypothetical protein [Arthrobacter bambusae]MDQ0241234.1 hypothetical protein [Arthrobacter bambusae]